MYWVYGSVFLSTALGGAGFAFMKNGLQVFSTSWFVFLRFFISFLLLVPFLWKRTSGSPRHTLKDGLLIGGLFFAATQIQIQGIAGTDAGRSAFINSASVVLVPIFEAFLARRRPSLKILAGCFLCFAGVGLLALPKMAGHSSGGTAELLVFLGTFIFACQTIVFKRAVHRSSANVLSFVQFGTIALLALPFALMSPFPAFDGFKGWDGVLYAAVAMNLAMLMISNNALRFISPTAFAVIGSMQSVYGALFGNLMLGEKITLQLVVSGSMILSGIVIVILASSRPAGSAPVSAKSGRGRCDPEKRGSF